MFIDFVIHICDRIMRQTAEQNPTNSDPKNLPTSPQETINEPATRAGTGQSGANT